MYNAHASIRFVSARRVVRTAACRQKRRTRLLYFYILYYMRPSSGRTLMKRALLRQLIDGRGVNLFDRSIILWPSKCNILYLYECHSPCRYYNITFVYIVAAITLWYIIIYYYIINSRDERMCIQDRRRHGKHGKKNKQ